MTLRDDVRDYFERESRRLPAPAGLRIDPAASPAARAASPAPGHQIRWAAVLAAVLAVAVILALVGSGRLRQALNPATTPAGHVPRASGDVEQVLDFDLADRDHGWALIGVCHQNVYDLGACQFWVLATRDGGHSWVDPVKVGGASGFTADSPRHIHFANDHDGFIYGLGIAFVTHDAGLTWSQLPGETSELVAITGFATVWAVLQPCATGAQCPFAVRSSSDGGRNWSVAASMPAGFQPQQAIAFGQSGLLLAGPGPGDLVMTDDGGRTWTLIPGRCPARAVGNYVATSDGQELLQLCNVATTPLVLRLFTSEDSGKTWAESSSLPGQGQMPEVGVQTILLVSPRKGWVLFDIGQLPIELTTDGGRTWTAVTSTAYFDNIVFSASGAGWAEHEAIYATNDGGRTWTKLASQPV